MSDMDQWGQEVLKELHTLSDRVQDAEERSEKNQNRRSVDSDGSGMQSKMLEILLTKSLNGNDKKTDVPTANGAIKGLGLIVTIITVLVGLVGIGEYMGRENEYIRKDLVRAETHVETINTELSEVSKIQSGVLVKFIEVETQFKGLREIVNLQQKFNEKDHDMKTEQLRDVEDWITWWNKSVSQENADQSAQIKMLKERLKEHIDGQSELMMKKYEAGRVVNRAGVK